MTVEEFRAAFLHFRTAPDHLIEKAIADATARVAPETFRTLTEQAIGQLAAHLLAISPFGVNLRLVDDKGKTTHLTEYERIANQCVVRMLVT